MTAGTPAIAGKEHQHMRETRPMTELKEVTRRPTTLEEKLHPAEQVVFDRFQQLLPSAQETADAHGLPIYFRYVYDKSAPTEGEFVPVEIEKVNSYIVPEPIVIPDGCTVGPLVSVYPTDVQEIYTVRTHNQWRQGQGVQTSGSTDAALWINPMGEILHGRKEAEEIKAYSYEQSVDEPVVDQKSVNLLFSQAIGLRGDEELRPMIFAARNGKTTIVTTGLNTASFLRDSAGRMEHGIPLSHYGILAATDIGMMSDLSPIQAIKYGLLTGKFAYGLSIIEHSAENIFEYTKTEDQENKKPILKTHEEEIMREVTDKLIAAHVPRKSQVIGGLIDLLHTVGVHNQSAVQNHVELGTTIPDFAAILKAVSAYGLEFTNMTVFRPNEMDSKMTPAIMAEKQNLPYPLTRRVEIRNGIPVDDSLLNPGSIEAPSKGSFVHESSTSRRRGIYFSSDTAETHLPQKDGIWVVMPQYDIHETERRFFFHPQYGIMHCVDREIPETIRNAGDAAALAAAKPKWTIVTLTPEEKRNYEALLREYDKGALARCLQGFGILDALPRYEQAYAEAGILPTLGASSFDIVWAKNSSVGNHQLNPEWGVPFISEYHTACQYPDEEALMKSFIKALTKDKPQSRAWVIAVMMPMLPHALIYDAMQTMAAKNQTSGPLSKIALNKMYAIPSANGMKPYAVVHNNRQSVFEAMKHVLRMAQMR